MDDYCARITIDFFGKIKAYQVINAEQWTILTTQGELISEKFRAKIIDQFSYPIIRRLSSGLILIADSRGEKGSQNAKVYDGKGNEIRQFYAGDAINDIIVCENRLIISYFDEGVFSEDVYAKEGLCIFSTRGQMLWGFNSSHSKYQIWDCYQIVKMSNRKILFYGYGEFPVLELNPVDLSVSENDLAVELYVDSISSYNGNLIWLKDKEIYKLDQFTKIRKAIGMIERPKKTTLVNNLLVEELNDGFKLRIID